MLYRWYVDDMNQGVVETYEEARKKLAFHLPWTEDAWTDTPSPIEKKEFFYQTEEDMQADDDGAYTPHIQELD